MIAGQDEVGMGPIAGPCVVASVVLTEPIPNIRDSKKLERNSIYRLAEEIRQKAQFVYIAHRLHTDIDRLGLQTCWALCQQECFKAVRAKFPGIEVQADFHPGIVSPKIQKYIQGINFIRQGDDECYEIGAASIVAKQWQLTWMSDAHNKYPKYGFNEHAGYGTQDHLAALKDFGACAIHRISAVSKIQKKNKKAAAAGIPTIPVEEILLPPDQLNALLAEAKPFLEKPDTGEWEKKFLGSILSRAAAGASLSGRQQFFLKRTVGKLKRQERRKK